jgi:integrase
VGTIEKRGANSWRVSVYLSGKAKAEYARRSFTYSETFSEQEQRHKAEIELARLEVEIADGKYIPTTTVTVRQLAEMWLRDHVIPNCEPTTASGYEHLMRGRILPAIGDMPINRLQPLDITRMLNNMRNEARKSTAIPADQRKRKKDRERASQKPAAPLSANTIRHYYDVLNYMFNKCIEWNLITANPMKRVKRPKVRRPKMPFLDDSRAIDLLRALAREESLPYRCAVLLALLCGLRLGEVGGLRLSDVNWTACTITISRALHYTSKSGSYIGNTKSEDSDRTVTLPAGMMTLLHETREYHRETSRLLGDRWRGDGRIVSAWDGTPLHHDTPSKWFRKFADKNGFEDIHFHSLRHSHVVILFANNIDAVAIAARIGHDSPETTFRFYSHAVQRRDTESASAMQTLIDAAAQPIPAANPTNPLSTQNMIYK